jgi:hypothetical protein
MITKQLNQQQLTALCGVLADTNRGLTKSEIKKLLRQCEIAAVDDGYRTNGLIYTTGMNKRDWLYNCFANEINKQQTFTRVYRFVEVVEKPSFTDFRR